MSTAYCYDDIYLKHNQPGHPENAGRLQAIMAGLQESKLLERLNQIPARPATEEEIAAIHTKSYIGQVRQVSEQGGGHLDGDTYTTAHSYQAALMAAGGLLALTQAVLDGEVQNGFALVRPPGHHAIPGRGMGFCIFNNIAVAAKFALTRPEVEKVMIVDFDVHHGNGTQDVFEASSDVLFVSTHQHPFYPGTGRIDESGWGEGAGTLVNVPLPAGVGDSGYAQIMQEIIWPLAHRYDPQLILVSAGFDAHWTDPLAMMTLSLEGYAQITRELANMADELCDGRIVFTLEGGYDPTVLANAVQNVFHILLGEDKISDPIGRSPYQEASIANLIQTVKRVHNLT